MIYDQHENKITVVIDKSGQAYLEGKKMDMKTLSERLEALVQEKDLFQVVLQADKDVRHGVVVQTMDIAKRAGVRSIVIAAHWKSDKVL
jgi:biopolymer transport protein ExbD